MMTNTVKLNRCTYCSLHMNCHTVKGVYSKYVIVEYQYQTFFAVIVYDLGPPAPSASEYRRTILYIQKVCTERGDPFRKGKGVGVPKSYDSTEALAFFTQYSLYVS